MFWILLSLLFANLSCDEVINTKYLKYNLNITEIDCNSNDTVISFKNAFISNEKGLFEYHFMFNTKSVLIGDSMSSKTREDSISISFIPQDVPIYYKFDFKGNLLKKDSVKNKTKDFFKIDQSNNQMDPLYAVINNLSEKDLIDTIFNNLKLKCYKHPQIFKDSSGDMALQLFFSNDTLFKTPFNVNNRYPKPFNKYNLVGFVFTAVGANRKMVAVMSDITEATKEEISLCDKILKNISTIK